MRIEKDELARLCGLAAHVVFMIILLAMIVFTMIGCSSLKEIPVNTIEKIEYRDSVVYVHDTLRVEVPRKIVKEVIPDLDTSVLRTGIAESIAFVDTARRRIHHTLEQKGEVEVRVDTFYTTRTVEKIIEKEVPVEVEVVKYKRDTLFWMSIIFNIIVVLLVVFRIWLKIR